MRKNIFISALALMSAIAFTSCMKENFEQAGDSQKGSGVNITVNTGSPDLKSYIEYDEVAEKYLPKWHKGDALGAYFVNDSGANPASLTNANDNGTKASFTGTASLTEGNYTLYAVYPARAVQNVTADMVVGLEFPYIQFPSATSFDPKADILVNVPHDVTIAAEQTDVTVDDMRFRRVGSIVKVVLSDLTGNLTGDKIKSVYLESDMPGVALSGVFEYDYKTEEAAGMSVSKNHVTADLTRLETLPVLDGQNAVYLVLPPCTLESGSNLTVNVKTDRHEVTKVITLGKDYAFPSSQMVQLNVGLDASCTVERVYFQDNFDWLYYWWDSIPSSDKDGIIDPIGAGTATGQKQPNIWSKYAGTIGADFSARGYVDLCTDNAKLYIQENYFKIGAGDKQTGIQLPSIEFGDEPKNVKLSFDWAVQDMGLEMIVDVLGVGVCHETATIHSNVMRHTATLAWQTDEVVLLGVTKDSRICIRPALNSLHTTGYYRGWIDNVKITETDVEDEYVAPITTFPVVWSMEDPTELMEGVDYVVGNLYDGSYIFSDEHNGKLTVVRDSGPNPSAPSTYGWRTDNNNKDPEYNGGTLLHYNMSLDNYWLFDVYNVKNPAGTYNISYFMSASNAGPKCFVLEYSVDNGENWVGINVNQENEWTFNDTSRKVKFTYALAPKSNIANEVCAVNESFHLAAIETNSTLKIRARVASDLGHQGNRLIGNGTNRIFKNITISFTPDAE